MRHARIAFAAFGLLVLSTAACHKPDDPSSVGPSGTEAAAPLHVQTAPVSEQPMPEYLTLTGSLHASQQSDIAADASGKVLQVLIERGQAVKAGQVIATLDAQSANLSATAAQAQSKLAQSQLEQSQRECERVRHLLDTGAISQAEFDRQTSQCTAQQWSAAAAAAQQQSATKLVGDARIRAPFDGIIGERLVNVGQYVDRNTRVASIYQADPLRLEVTIPEANLASIHEGVEVTFAVSAFGDDGFAAPSSTSAPTCARRPAISSPRPWSRTPTRASGPGCSRSPGSSSGRSRSPSCRRTRSCATTARRASSWSVRTTWSKSASSGSERRRATWSPC
jgi:multidrug efflux pump subunit AcrA (membrane-fusion protein)